MFLAHIAAPAAIAPTRNNPVNPAANAPAQPAVNAPAVVATITMRNGPITRAGYPGDTTSASRKRADPGSGPGNE